MFEVDSGDCGEEVSENVEDSGSQVPEGDEDELFFSDLV